MILQGPSFNKFISAVTFSVMAALLSSTGLAQAQSAQSIAKERASSSQEAFQLLRSGDTAYEAGDYAQAVTDFSSALSKVSTGTKTETLRIELADRYATAASQQSKALVRAGKLAKAKKLLNTALEVAPNNTYAQKQLAKLDDPIATNPSITPELVQDIDQVRRLLYKAEGAYNLGKFKESYEHYSSILRIDPHNKAARRGMETIHKRQSEYYESAYDQTRATLLANVAKEWELSNPQTESGIQADMLREIESAKVQGATNLMTKLDSIIFPIVDFDDSTLLEALDTIRALSKVHDTFTLDEKKKGIQIISKIASGNDALNRTFTLKLTNVPLREVLDQTATLLRVRYNIDPFAISFSTTGSADDALIVKSYNVAPDFLSNTSSAAPAASNDPFAASSSSDSTGLAGKRMTAQEILQNAGVKFENGATATFLAATSTLVVKNTDAEHQTVLSVINSLEQDTPAMVVIEARVMEINQNNAEDLGVDWSVTGTVVDSVMNGLISGGSAGNQFGFEDLAGNPVTAGNRTGTIAQTPNSIDALLQRQLATGSTMNTVYDVFDLATNPGNPLAALISSGFTEGTATTQLFDYNRSPGIFGVQAAVNNETMLAMVRGLKQKTGTDFIQEPTFVTKSGQAAKIYMGREFLYPTEFEPPQLTSGGGQFNFDLTQLAPETTWYVAWDDNDDLKIVYLNGQLFTDDASYATPSTPMSFESTLIGTEVDVLPTVSADRQTIELSVKTTYRDFEGFIDYGSPLSGVSTNLSFTGANDLTNNNTNLTTTNPLALNVSSGTDPFPPGPALPGMNMVQEIVPVSENDILMPIFNTSSTETNVTIYNGATLIIGGLVESRPVKVQDKTPILGSIPMVGSLFQSQATVTEKKQVIIAITARVVDPTGRQIQPLR